MKVVAVIPSRWGSTRFEGKPLAQIAGKPMVAWVIAGAKESKKVSEVLVATDDSRIANEVEKWGAIPVMTSSDCATGTDRVWQAVQKIECDLVLNVQGDEPLIRGSVLDSLIEPFESSPSLSMATLGRPLTLESVNSMNAAKVVLNKNGDAMFFSRYPIPYSRINASQDSTLSASLQHIGIYAYRKNFLKLYCAQEPVAIENAESLEQLRALYLGAQIRVVLTQHEAWGVDTPSDVEKIEGILRRQGRIQ